MYNILNYNPWALNYNLRHDILVIIEYKKRNKFFLCLYSQSQLNKVIQKLTSADLPKTVGMQANNNFYGDNEIKLKHIILHSWIKLFFVLKTVFIYFLKKGLLTFRLGMLNAAK